MFRFSAIALLVFFSCTHAFAQSGLCNSGVPFLAINLTGSADSTYVSPPITRANKCCGVGGANRCLEFQITLDSNAVGINFQIYSGASPSGSLFYQINCGTPVAVGQPICVSGVGPHTLTFCKPGNNTNRYAITSLKGFSHGMDISTVEGCQAELQVNGLVESTITWNDITGGGFYNSFLSCTSGCSMVMFNSQPGFPSYVDYRVCGTMFSGTCQSIMQSGCDTVRMNINPAINIAITPSPPIFCTADGSRTLSAVITPVKDSYDLFWTNGPNGSGTVVSTDTFYTASTSGTYSIVVIDTEFALCSADTINFPVVFSPSPTVVASPDSGFCAGYGVKVIATGAQSYTWSPAANLSCPTCATAWASPPTTTTYVVTGTAANACTDTDTVTISVHSHTSVTIDSTICIGEVVVVGTVPHSTTGTSVDTLTGFYGCDSTVTLNLTVLPVADSSVNVSFCLGDSIVVGSSVYTTSGVYVDVLVATNGCDSTVTTTVLVLNPAFTAIDTAFCLGQTITVGSSVYSATGTYVDTLTRTNGCDSIITTNLLVNNPAFITLNPAICIGSSFSVGSSSYNTTGTYFDTLLTSAGCDSVIQTNLLVKPEAYVTIDSSICAGGFVIVGTSVYSTTGNYVDTLTGSNACDSIVTLNLTVMPLDMEWVNVSICAGDSVVVGSSVYFSAGIYIDVLTGSSGCDSTVITAVVVLQHTNTTLNPVLCAGATFTVGSSVYSATGTYVDTLTRANGCDSIVTTNLTIINPITVAVNAAICIGDSYTVGASNYTTAGNYVDTLTAASGCDSIVQTNLTVMALLQVTVDSSICQGDFVIVGASVYFNTGNYQDTLTGSNGCDSIVTLNLTVYPTTMQLLNFAICTGDSIVVGSSVYTTAGNYVDVLVSAYGCDSTVISNVVLLQHANVTLNPVLCLGATFTVGSSVYSATGTYHDTLTRANGCDSIITTNLTIINPINVAVNAAICIGDSYIVGTSNYTTAGNYVDTLTAASGCDSIVSTNLTVMALAQVTVDSSICQGEFVVVGASVYFSTGNYLDTLTGSNGCDSIVTLNLTVHPTTMQLLNFAICAGDSVVVGSSVYTTAGNYVDVLVSAYGCDSTVISNVVLLHHANVTLNPVLCQGATFTVGSSVYSATGTYSDTLTRANGCDSIITTNLTIINPINVAVNAAICIGDSYTVGASNYTIAGNYVDTLTAASGCDSMVTTNLTVMALAQVTVDSSICQGEFVVVGASVYSASGTYTDTLTGSNSCDSIVTLNLTVHPMVMAPQNIVICAGDSVVVGSSVYSAPGTYVNNLVSSTGCDSIVITTIQVNNPVAVTINPVLCLGQTITVGSSVYSAAGTYSDTLTGSNGCDSTITTNLTVINPDYVTINTSICDGETYVVGSSNYTASGSYVDTLVVSSGCDSIVTLNLAVLPVSTQTLNEVICQGESEAVGSSVYTATGNYVDTLVAANGCDSIVTLNLTVLPVLADTVLVSMCQGDSATIGGTVYNTTGTYYDTLTGSNTCDSIVVIAVTVHSPAFITLNPALCLTSTFSVGSSTYDSTGTYVDSLTTSFGCDSVVTTNLTIADSLYISITTTICFGENYIVGSSSYDSAGVYYDTITTSGICDSVVHTQLIVLPTSGDTVTRVICAGDAVMVGTSAYSSTGNYIDTLVAFNGCDSIVTLNLTVLSVSLDTLNIDMCEGDSVVVGPSVYYTAGIYSDTFIKTNGCDSVITTLVQVRNRAYHTINSAICLGDTINVAGSSYAATGTYRDTLVGANGCDSVITTNLTVINPKFTTLNPAICIGASFSVGSSTYSTTGTFYDTLVAASGCDSIVRTNLLVKPIANVTLNSTVCPGGFVVVGTSIYSSTGTYVNTLIGPNGCDSIVTLNLTVKTTPITSLNVAICTGDSVIVGSSVYKTAGTYNKILTGSFGCDSVVITTLVVNYPVFSILNPTICLGDSFTAGTSTYFGTGSYVDTLVAANACDSIITTNLTVLSPLNVTVNAEICIGETYTVGTSNYTTTGSYTDTLISSAGCDSIVQTNLIVNPESYVTLNTTVCPGGFVMVGSSIYSSSGTYVDTLTGSNGCDSTVTLNLTVKTTPITRLDIAICTGDSVVVGNSVYKTAGTYNKILTGSYGCDSVVITTLVVNYPVYTSLNPTICLGDSVTAGTSTYFGTGSYVDTLVAANACDSIITTNLTVLSPLNVTVNAAICIGETYTVGTSNYTNTGSYTDSLISSAGCDSIVQTNLIVNPETYVTLNTTVCPGGFVMVGSSIYSSSGTYKDTLTGPNGCDSTVTLNLTVKTTPITRLDLAICTGDSVVVGSSVYKTAGTYNNVLTGSYGCDSVVITTLVVHYPVYTTLNPTICLGDSIIVGTSTYSATGTYVDSLVAANSCDSVITTNLTVLNPLYVTLNAAICIGETYLVGTSNYTNTGSYSDTLISSAGCDSIVQTNLVVLPVSYVTVNTAICPGDVFIMGASAYFNAGTYVDTLTSSIGCDSIVTLNLSIFPIATELLYPVICRDDSVVVGSSVYYNAGVYNDILADANGCDSVVITTLQVLYPTDTTINPVLCLGDSILAGNSVYSATGVYYDTIAGSNGCDSIITTNLTVIDPKYTTVSTSICDNESYAVGSSNYTTTGSYIDTLIATSGCDSMVTLNLTVLPTSVTIVNVEICEGDSTVTGSSVYFNTGTYYDTLIKANGCDSVVVTSVIKHDWVYTTVNDVICDGETFAVGSSIYNASGTYNDTLTSYVGCDSIVTLNLFVQPPISVVVDTSICQGETISVGSSIYSSAGSYLDTLQSIYGCDSVVQTNLQINPILTTILNPVICAGDFVAVGSSTYSTTGNYVDTLMAATSCDSIVQLQLTVQNPTVTALNVVLCYGNTFFVGYEPYYQSGFYVDSFLDRFGCDSTIELTLEISPLEYTVIDTVLCQDQSLTVGSSIYNSSGIYFDTLFSAYNCDSIVETRLSVIAKSYTVVSPSICNGGQFIAGNSIYTSDGTYQDTLMAANGCDSIITTHLTVYPLKFTSIDTSFCPGDSLSVGSSIYKASGIYFDTLSTVHGCDSVIRTDLFVFTIIHGSQDTFLCRGDTIQLPLSGGVQYQWLNATGLSCNNCPNPNAYPHDDINYLVRVTDMNGCIRSDTIRVKVGFVEAEIIRSDSVVCQEQTMIFTTSFNSDDSLLTWQWNFGDGSFSVNQNPAHSFADSGLFQISLTATNASGCMFLDDASVTVIPNPEVIISNDTAICQGDSAVLNVSGANSYAWLPGSFLDDPSSISPVAFPLTTIQYTVTGTALNGCVSFADVLVTVNPLPVVQVSEDTSICLHKAAPLSASGGTSYLWSPADGLSDTISSNIIASPAQTTVYHVQLTNQFGCFVTDSVRVEIYPEIQFQVSPSGDVCLGESILLNADGAASYSWYPPMGLSCTSCNNPNASPNSNITYSVIATDTYGCLYEDSVAIAVRKNPSVQSIQDITVCRGETVVLQTDTVLVSSYGWSPARFLDDANQLSPVSTPDDSIAYVVSVVNEYGCARWDTVNINVIEEVAASMQGDDAVCRGGSSMIEVEVEQASANGFDIIWLPANYFNQQNLNQQSITPNQDMVVTAIVNSETCVADTVEFEIEVNELPEVDAGEDRNVYFGESVWLHAESSQIIDSYNWSSPELLECGTCETAQWQADYSRSFVVNVVDENGCSSMDTVLYRVTGGCKDDIFVPNGFTPNGDEANDKFFIRSIHEVKLEYFKIFDRWGREVYSSNDITEGWDGTHPGGWNRFYNNNLVKDQEESESDVIPGVYVYVFKIGCRNGHQAVMKGNITLIR